MRVVSDFLRRVFSVIGDTNIGVPDGAWVCCPHRETSNRRVLFAYRNAAWRRRSGAA